MKCRVNRLWTGLALLATAISCTSGNPGQPSSTNQSSGGSSIAAPRPAQPADGTVVPFSTQPVTLVVQNAVVTSQVSGTTYTFEIATDNAFTSKTQVKDPVNEGSGGRTSVQLEPLAAARTYYWHARAQNNGTVSVFGPVQTLVIGPAVTISQPAALSPLSGTATSVRPTFVVANATWSGPIGVLTYKFEVSASATFSPVVLTGNVSPGVAQTSFTAPSDLTANQTYYWRATAIDVTNGVSSVTSAVQSFTTSANTLQARLAAQEGLTLWPSVQPPPGTNGHASLGDNWDVQNLVSFHGVRFVSPPISTLQVFDLIDRGMSPQGAIDWMNANGYPGAGAYYPVGGGVIGFDYIYIAVRAGNVWDLILRGE